ncbi:unnamed protein product [Closterium sp. Naga37s-1]|nr:unnamed protein product [Closterium sp. Naga37s-1]
MAVWDSQFQRVSTCDGGGGAPTALDIARVAAAGQQRFGRGCVLVQVHDDDSWGIMEDSENTGDLAGVLKATEAPTVGESTAAESAGTTAGDSGSAGAAGEVEKVGVEVPVVSQGDLTGLVRCAGDSSRLLQLTAPTNRASSSSSSSGGGGSGGADFGSTHEEGVFDAELVEGGRKAEEIGGNNTGKNALQVADAMSEGMPEWGGEAPYDEHRGEFVLVLWLHMDGQAVAGADVVRACSVGNPEGLCSLVEFAGVGLGGDEVKLLVRDMEGVEEEEEAELEIV